MYANVVYNFCYKGFSLHLYKTRIFLLNCTFYKIVIVTVKIRSLSNRYSINTFIKEAFSLQFIVEFFFYRSLDVSSRQSVEVLPSSAPLTHTATTLLLQWKLFYTYILFNSTDSHKQITLHVQKYHNKTGKQRTL